MARLAAFEANIAALGAAAEAFDAALAAACEDLHRFARWQGLHVGSWQAEREDDADSAKRIEAARRLGGDVESAFAGLVVEITAAMDGFDGRLAKAARPSGLERLVAVLSRRKARRMGAVRRGRLLPLAGEIAVLFGPIDALLAVLHACEGRTGAMPTMAETDLAQVLVSRKALAASLDSVKARDRELAGLLATLDWKTGQARDEAARARYEAERLPLAAERERLAAEIAGLCAGQARLDRDYALFQRLADILDARAVALQVLADRLHVEVERAVQIYRAVAGQPASGLPIAASAGGPNLAHIRLLLLPHRQAWTAVRDMDERRAAAGAAFSERFPSVG